MNKRYKLSDHLILLSIIVGFFVWIAESYIHVMMKHNSSLALVMLSLEPHETVTRLMFFAIVICAGIIGQSMLNKRKKIEEELKRSEDRYRSILDNMEEAYYEVDLRGTLTFFNSTAEKRLGYTNDEMKGMHFLRLVDKENARKAYEVYNHVYVTGEPTTGFDWELTSKSGERIPVESSVSLRLDHNNKPIGFRGVVRDITARQKAEEALLASEERSRLIAENAKVVIWMMDLDLRYIYISPYIKHNLEYTPEEYVAKPLNEVLTPSSLELCMKVFAEELEVEKRADRDLARSRAIEVEHIHRDGRIIWAEINMTFIRDSKGKATGILGITQDITGRRLVQEELRKSEESYRAIFENTGNASVIFGEDTIIQLANSKFVQLSGYSKQETEGRISWTQFIVPEDLEKMKRYHTMRRIDTGTAPDSYEFRAVRRSGEVIDIFMSISIIPGTKVSIASMTDVSERKRIDEALRQSEAKHRFLTEKMNDVLWTMDMDLNFTYISPSIERVVGFSQDERMHQRPEDTMTPESFERGVNILAEELRREGEQNVDPDRTVQYEAEYYHKNGSTVWIENVISAIRDDDGKMVGLYGVSRDISERKRAEERIRKSEERYRTIFESTATANVIIAEDTTILMANSDFAEMSGYSKQELEGKMSWTAFIAENDLDRMKEYSRQRRVNPLSAPASYEFKFVNRSGALRDLFISVALLPGTGESVASMIDITDWKRSEQARYESEQRFKDLAELLPETVYEADRNGIFIFVNKTGFEKFGYDYEDIFRKKSVFEMMVPEDHPRMIATYQRLVKGEQVGLSEYTAVKKDGSTFPALVHATAIFREGKPAGHRGFIIDITEKKNLENQLLRAQKMEAIGTLAGGIAHDFNNLLMGILGNISLIMMQYDQSSPIYNRLKNMEAYVERGSDLTKQLLGFARGGKYEVKATDIGEFLVESSDLFGRTKKEIHIHRSIQDGLWAAEVDQGQIEQVLLNLYLNAWQAMPGGGDLYLSTENVELDELDVSPFDLKPGRYVKVTVTDTGMGMDESTKARIFEPFFTTKERGRGTGLGLASAYGIIKNHGGFIHVESEKGAGTSFMIFLPASDRKIDPLRKSETDILKGHETILIIDDEEMILDIGAQMLESLGYSVLSARGGRQGVQVFDQNRDRIDLVILDIIMPELGGKDTFDILKRIKPSVKVLLSSGYSLDGQAKEIMQKGCRGFIQKPFSIESLSIRIRDILDQ